MSGSAPASHGTGIVGITWENLGVNGNKLVSSGQTTFTPDMIRGWHDTKSITARLARFPHLLPPLRRAWLETGLRYRWRIARGKSAFEFLIELLKRGNPPACLLLALGCFDLGFCAHGGSSREVSAKKTANSKNGSRALLCEYSFRRKDDLDQRAFLFLALECHRSANGLDQSLGERQA